MNTKTESEDPVAQPPEPFRELAWDAARAREFTDQAVDLWQEFLERLPELPVATSANEAEVAAAVTRPVPEEPLADSELFGYLREALLDTSTFPGHPRFMAYITGVRRAVRPPRRRRRHRRLRRRHGELRRPQGGARPRRRLGRALPRRRRWPRARDLRLDRGARRYRPWRRHARPRLGRGSQGPGHGRLPDRRGGAARGDPEDRAAGKQPLAVVATAGTVSTGAIDPLPEIAALCAEEGLWLHVDAAYGGPAVLADDLRPLFAGIERADSIAFDPHKWLYTPHSGGCVVVRDLQHLADAFAVHPTYIHEDKERSGHGIDLAMLGPQFSRGFQALKI